MSKSGGLPSLKERPVWRAGCKYVASETAYCKKCGHLHTQTYEEMKNAMAVSK